MCELCDCERISVLIHKLSQLETVINQFPSHDAWCTMQDAIHYTKLSDRTLRRAVQQGQLRASQETGKILFRKAWLDTFILFGKKRLNTSEQQRLKQLQ